MFECIECGLTYNDDEMSEDENICQSCYDEMCDDECITTLIALDII